MGFGWAVPVAEMYRRHANKTFSRARENPVPATATAAAAATAKATVSIQDTAPEFALSIY